MASAVLWFRRDLRLDDLPALAAAASVDSGGILPLFVVDASLLDPAGPNRRCFLAECLRALDRELRGTLVLRQGDPRIVVPAVAAEVGARVVAASADFGPYGAARDQAVAEALSVAGRSLLTIDSPYVVAPGTVRGSSGSPLRVFSPFRRAWESVDWKRPVPPPAVHFVSVPSDATLDDIETGVRVPSHSGLPAWWEGLPLGKAEDLPKAGSSAARNRLERFVTGSLSAYATDRDRPGVVGTSGLSPYLRFGCIHPRTVLMQLGTSEGADRMRAELVWREFYADVLWHRPESARHPLQAFGAHLHWDVDARARRRFQAWATGHTGYPLVDAGMRQLLVEGWMHNRVRMITASFLVKDLHVDWRFGARWFMWHLVDGDLASNQHGWQWVAGTGTDAAPFHRVLNPIVQQQRFDPDGVYIRRYLGEPPPVQRGDQDLWAVGSGHPEPIIDHLVERREALERFDVARQAAATEKASRN